MIVLFEYISKKNRIALIVAVFFILIQVVLETAIPVFMGKITNLIQSDTSELGDIIRMGGIMLIYASLAFLASIIAGYIIAYLAGDVCTAIRKSIFEKIISFSEAEVTQFGTGSLINRCTDDVSSVQLFMTQCLRPIVQAPILAAIVCLKISTSYGAWTASTIVTLGLVVVLIVYVFKSAIQAIKKSNVLRDKLATKTREHVFGIRVIHAYNSFDNQKEEYDSISNELAKLGTRQEKALSAFLPSSQALMYGLSAAIYITGAFIISKAAMGDRPLIYSTMVEFVSYVSMLLYAFMSIVTVVLLFPMTSNSLKRIKTIMDTKVQITDGSKDTVFEKGDGSVEFKNVSFKYPGSKENAVSDISFKITKGQTLAIVGGTGSGKTTVLNLIPRLYEAAEGQILIDGRDIREYKLDDLRVRLGYVPQKSFLFNCKISDNIGYGEKNGFKASLEHIINAAKVGQANDFITKKEKGYDEMVLSGGINFSGGQRQRLTISRALNKEPEIYIFDDSFSALDFKTEKTLRKELKKTSKDATKIIVGQRIGTIRDADLIIVLDAGRIVGSGRHEELIKECNVYKEIVLSQEEITEKNIREGEYEN